MASALGPPLLRGFQRLVEELTGGGLLHGALLVSRDGFALAGELPSVDRPEMFAAMQATALGAAELALDPDGSSRATLLCEREGRRFVARGADDTTFVVAEVPYEADAREIVAAFEIAVLRMTEK